MKYRILISCLSIALLSSAVMTEAQNRATVNKEDQSEAKELSGMKSLYIVPWKSSEIGGETSMNTMLNEDDTPVDRDVFRRQLEFYQVSTAN